jgi:hypothetical protein
MLDYDRELIVSDLESVAKISLSKLVFLYAMGKASQHNGTHYKQGLIFIYLKGGVKTFLVGCKRHHDRG